MVLHCYFPSPLCKGVGMVMQNHRGTSTPFMSDALILYLFSISIMYLM
jgi:hypothetical protein